jgi:hypothetical protein
MPTSTALDIDGRSTSAPQPSALQKRLANPTMARFSDAGFAESRNYKAHFLKMFAYRCHEETASLNHQPRTRAIMLGLPLRRSFTEGQFARSTCELVRFGLTRSLFIASCLQDPGPAGVSPLRHLPSSGPSRIRAPLDRASQAKPR